eukprot:TRINITY_DN16342_c0_g1_i2.p1 TRINITY_DN16342_c0_g1~~TRINITY_DN16342_c0_g1_i2.p1  ORF type:complete len:269 (+),score=42.40 TRINITY_DN16342_c0_g1_i2:100-906(+)
MDTSKVELVVDRGKYDVSADKLASIVAGYQQRAPTKWDDLNLVEELGGIQTIANSVRTDLEQGLPENEVSEHRSQFGSNMRPPPSVRGFCRIMWDALEDTLLRVLFFCGIVSIIINMITEEDKALAWIDGFGMIVAVVIVTLVTTVNDWQKERQFLELNKKAEQSKEVHYVTNGRIESKHEGKVVVGDILIIETGKSVPADGLLIAGNGVKCDESSMTGETVDCKKETLEDCRAKLEQLRGEVLDLSLIHICRCRRYAVCRSRWSPYH